LKTGEYDWKEAESPFLYLTSELPPPPLFKDEFHENIIPQVSLYNILSKFNGVSEKEYKTYKDNFIKRFEITRLPKFIILYIKRFTKNTFFVEKNPTIVNFPVKSIELGDLLSEEDKAKHKEANCLPLPSSRMSFTRILYRKFRSTTSCPSLMASVRRNTKPTRTISLKDSKSPAYPSSSFCTLKGLPRTHFSWKRTQQLSIFL
jgi:hypothetical protein